MLYIMITLQRAHSFGLLQLLNQWLWLALGSQLFFYLKSQLKYANIGILYNNLNVPQP